MDVYIAGAGGSGLKVVQVLEDLAESGNTDFNLVGYVDDHEKTWGTTYFDYPIIGSPEVLLKLAEEKKIGVICPIGEPTNRYKVINSLKKHPNIQFPSIIHPSAQISSKSQFGEGNLFSQNVVIQAGVHIGNFNTFNMAATMGPLATVENFCTINSQVMLASLSKTNDFCYVGMGAKIMQKVELMSGITVGACSFVNKQQDAWSIVVGVPAKKVKEKAIPNFLNT